MKTLVLGRNLSFPDSFHEDVDARLIDICHHKKETGMYYLQSPKLDALNRVLETFGMVATLDEHGKESYDEAKKVAVRFNPEKLTFNVRFPAYPSYPLFNKMITKRWIWLNMAWRASKESPVYEVKHAYQLVEAIKWLEGEGYDVSVDDTSKEYITPRGGVPIHSMKKADSFELKGHQVIAENDAKKNAYRVIVAADAGMGKTVISGQVMLDLFTQGLLDRVLWVVPTSPLVSQVLDEMKGRYDLDGIGITGESMTRADRLGKADGSDVTIYEKTGFPVTTWAMFVKDFTGKTYHEITKRIQFDMIILDEGHRSQYGNKAFDAALNVVAPCRVILSGTIMPNGDWRELHNLVSTIAPASVMAQWYFSNMEEEKERDLALDPDIKYPYHEAKKQIASIIVPLLMQRVTRHVKTDHMELLPKLAEASIHVDLNKDEDKIVEKMIDMLSDIIETWHKSFHLKNGSKEARSFFKTIENAKNVVWQDLRRFCSHGSFRLKKRMDDIIAGTSPVHEWLKKEHGQTLKKIRSILDSPDIRPQPKNEKVIAAINRVNPDRCLVFNDSVLGSIELAKYLANNGKNVKVIVGADDQFTSDDADEIGQSNDISDAEIENILEWFWFPWKTVAKFSAIDPSLDVMFTGNDGTTFKSMYYVDGYKLGKNFTITLSWTTTTRDTLDAAHKIIDTLATSPSLVVDAEVPPKRGAWESPGKIVVAVKFTKKRDKRILVTTDKLNEGANLQIANLIVFYDQPMSIKQKEQRVARAWRMESMHESIGLVTVKCGLDYAIDRTLGMKYETAKLAGGYVDSSPVSMQDVLKMVKQGAVKSEGEAEQPSLLDFIQQASGGDGDEGEDAPVDRDQA